ncbi:MAG TPA: regulatory protein RecX [Myxococcales bacterium]|jgi:regulatory protein
MSSAQDYALKLLGHHARSEVELRKKLEAKGFASDEIDQAIARLKELRYLDDEALADSRAEKMVQAERKGPQLAVHKLQAAGIEEERAETAVESAKGGASDRELALQALEQRKPALAPDAPRAERYKAARWLAARGFSEETIRDVLRLDEE